MFKFAQLISGEIFKYHSVKICKWENIECVPTFLYDTGTSKEMDRTL